MNSNIKTAVFCVVIIMVVVLLWTVVRQPKSRPDQQLSFTQLLTEVDNERVKAITITGNDAHGTFANDQGDFHAVVPPNYQPMIDLMRQKKVDIHYYGSGWVSVLISAIPFVLLLASWFFMMGRLLDRLNRIVKILAETRKLNAPEK
jgi:cell division protease FtsH